MCFGGKKKEEPVAAAEVKEEEVVKEAEKTEAVKAEEVKEAALFEKAETFTAPVSTLDKDSTERRRQKELSQDIEAPLTGDALAGTMTSMLGKKEGGSFENTLSNTKEPRRREKISYHCLKSVTSMRCLNENLFIVRQ